MSTRVLQPPTPVLILALDGATFDVIRPMAEQGELPNLSRWMQEGNGKALPSTLPPMTFPAWSSFMTGLDPGEHGVLDFTQKVPGAYRLRFTNASDRAGRSLFARVCDAGGRVLVLGMPGTFPPEPLAGLLVPGFDAPVSSGTDPRSASDPALYREIEQRAGPWMRPDLKEGAEEGDFHERAVGTLLERIERKTRFARAALEALVARGGRPDLFTIVFSESDTVGHHYFRDHDPDSPRHDPEASETRKTAIRRVYAALDAACGELRHAYGEDAVCLVVSDHGMGPASRWIVHLNRYLAEQGLLARRRLDLSRLARLARDTAVRWLPPTAAQAIFRRARASAASLESVARFGGLDWTRTLAFSEEANTNPGVWINLRGREARGSVAPETYEAVRGRVIDALLAWRLPSGEPVIASARRREDVYRGPYTDRAPDIVVELGSERGYGLSLVATPWSDSQHTKSLRRLADGELAGGRGKGMNGTHRREGIFIQAPSVPPGPARTHAPAPESLVDVAPFVLRAMGLEADDAKADPAGPRTDYTDEEDALVSARLRALGYLE